MNLTQYLESQKDQDMTRLLYFTRTQEGKKEGVSVCSRMEERRSLYSSGKENMNKRAFNQD